MANGKKYLGPMVDRYIAARAVRLDLEKQASAQKKIENELSALLLKEFKTQKTEIASGKLGYAKYHKYRKPRIGDWRSVCDYVRDNDAFDLFEKRLSVAAVEARIEDGEDLPGLEWYDLENFSVGGV